MYLFSQKLLTSHIVTKHPYYLKVPYIPKMAIKQVVNCYIMNNKKSLACWFQWEISTLCSNIMWVLKCSFNKKSLACWGLMVKLNVNEVQWEITSIMWGLEWDALGLCLLESQGHLVSPSGFNFFGTPEISIAKIILSQFIWTYSSGKDVKHTVFNVLHSSIMSQCNSSFKLHQSVIWYASVLWKNGLRHGCANYPLKWAPSVFDILLNWN